MNFTFLHKFTPESNLPKELHTTYRYQSAGNWLAKQFYELFILECAANNFHRLSKRWKDRIAIVPFEEEKVLFHQNHAPL